MSAQGSSATRGKLRTRRLVSFRSALIVFGIVGWAMALSVGSSFGDGDNNPGTFDPTVTFETSTTRATAHPDARITIDNSGNTADVGSVSISLPNGLWGSLAAVSEKCANFGQPGLPGDETWVDDCDDDSKIGTVKATATIDQSEATLTGDVFIVEPASPESAAGIGIRVRAKVGGVDMGYVRVLGIATIRGNAQGLDTLFENLPNSITQVVGPNSRTVNFHLEKMTVDLKSELDGPNKPLLTNPSRCGSSDFLATVGAGSTIGGVDDVSFALPYVVDGCETTRFRPDSFSFVNTDVTPGQPTGFSTSITFPEGSASTSQIRVRLPGIGPNNASFGEAEDRCPSDSAVVDSGVIYFDPSSCPAVARVGTVTIETPLVTGSVTGDVYLIDRNPIPWLGIDVNPYIPGNPAGVYLRLAGETGTPDRDASCVSGCEKVVSVLFSSIPDAPVTSIYLEVNGPDRAGSMATLSGKILSIASASNCQPQDEALADFWSNSDTTDVSGTPKTSASASTFSFTGCNADPVTLSGGPIGGVTSDTTPTFTVAPGTSPGPGFFCAIDIFTIISHGTACTTSYTKATPLSLGSHYVYASTISSGGNTSQKVGRGFAIADDLPTPGPAPTTSYDGTPPTTTGPEPTFDFTADQDSHFQCSLDGGAFLPCGNVGTPSQTGSYTVTTDNAFLAGSTHTFAVRAQNEEGTVDLTPVEFTFDVSVAFAPTFDVISTTTQARAHPDLDVTIEHASEEKLSATTIKLPDGFMGGLQGVQTQCEPAVAAAGNCPASSKVGTIDTEATVDDSETIVRISGDVFMTKKLQPTDVAGLSIKVDAVIQEIDLGSIIVPARLTLRGNAQGVDSMVVDIPESIVPSNPFGDTETFFNIRKMTLKLRTGAGAAQPLLTNASACGTSNFSAEFTGNGSPSPSTTGPVLVPYTVTGCDSLGFAPALSATMVRSADGQLVNSTEFQPINFTANLSASPDQAGIKDASVLLPKPITIDILKLPIGLCEEAQYLTDTCSPTTIIGNATATSPLLPAGEVLSGNIYLLKAVPPRVIPRLFIRLKGLDGGIAINVVAVNSFENGTQIRADFTNLPDAPLNSFQMNVNNFLLSQKSPCQDAATFGSAITGTLTGHNGKTSPVNAGLQLKCKGIYGTSKYKKGKNPTHSMSLEARYGQPGFKSAKLQYGKLLTINKKRIKRALVIKANGKKLAAKCFRIKRKNILDLNLCKKTYTKLEISFKKGALVGGKKLKKPTVKLTLKDAGGNSYSKTLDLRKNISPAQLLFEGK